LLERLSFSRKGRWRRLVELKVPDSLWLLRSRLITCPETWWQATPSQEQQLVLGFHEGSKEPEEGCWGKEESGWAVNKSLLSWSKAVLSLSTQCWTEIEWVEEDCDDNDVEFVGDEKHKNRKQSTILQWFFILGDIESWYIVAVMVSEFIRSRASMMARAIATC
jgi:hypothetical protein